MRKQVVLLIFIMTISIVTYSQSRGVKIGYIDMEYILQNVPDYMEAKSQLEQKAQKWKQEIEAKKNEVTKLKESLKTEKVLLTKELIEEREEEIVFQETELFDYQQKRFGPNGDLILQKAVLSQPIQDQVFTAAQDIAEAKKYDFIFDKSSDLTMLFAAKRFDISDQVVRVITRATKRNQLSKKQLKLEEEKEARENLEDENPAAADRKKILDDKKAAREQLIAERKAAIEEKKKAVEENRKQLLAEKAAKKNGVIVPEKNETESTLTNAPETNNSETNNSDAKVTPAPDNSAVINAKQKLAEIRAKDLEERKKALEEKKKKILADREAAKKEKEASKETENIKN
jgi:Skp family chaperone for outer membrane proteins